MLVAFDFDGTLSDSEMTVLLGEQAGVADEIADITERAMNDELSYPESLRARAELLAGLPEADVAAALDRVELRPGAANIVAALRAADHRVAVLTGGFERGVERALSAAGVNVDVDAVVANRLPSRDGALTGGVEGPLVGGTKDDALEELAADLGVDETVAVGDGANDLPMLEVAGLAVGYDPKPAVEPLCDAVVDSMVDLRALFERRAVL